MWWWALTVSNRRPTPCKGAALPTELSAPHKKSSIQSFCLLARKKLWNFGILDFNRTGMATEVWFVEFDVNHLAPLKASVNGKML
jgi:hypothetical protein